MIYIANIEEGSVQ